MRKTIKVRIPAVITPDGKWCAYGYDVAQQDPDWSMCEEVACGEELSMQFKRMWITAELPLPEMEETVSALAVEQE